MHCLIENGWLFVGMYIWLVGLRTLDLHLTNRWELLWADGHENDVEPMSFVNVGAGEQYFQQNANVSPMNDCYLGPLLRLRRLCT